jgi:hypothetical protein
LLRLIIRSFFFCENIIVWAGRLMSILRKKFVVISKKLWHFKVIFRGYSRLRSYGSRLFYNRFIARAGL